MKALSEEQPVAARGGFADLFHGEATRLVRLATLLGADEVRSRQRRLAVVRRRTPPPEPPLGSAEETAIVRAEHRLLLEALARLPQRRREALVLRYWLDLTVPQIAEVMGVSAGTVKAQLSRGLRALEKNLRTSE